MAGGVNQEEVPQRMTIMCAVDEMCVTERIPKFWRRALNKIGSSNSNYELHDRTI